MSLAKSKSGIEIPARMRNKLEKFQKRVWTIKLAEGILAAAFGLLASYLLVFVLDRFFETPAIVRAVILVVGALGLGLWFPLVCHKWIWKSRQLEQVAKLLKFKFPRLGDHLLGIIELVNNSEESGRSEALTRAALAQVDEETKDRDFSNAVPNPRHAQWGLIAGVPAVIAAAVLILVPAAGGNALMRWLMPWKHTQRYTFAQIDELPESIVVPIAENSSLAATLSDQTKWTPDSGSAYVSGTTVNSKQENGKYDFSLPPLKQQGQINVSIGDIRDSVNVLPMPRPELHSLIANIKLPEYLQREQLVTKDIRGGVVSTVTGSEVSFVATASRAIAEATVDGNAIQVQADQMLTQPVLVDQSSQLEFQWIDTLGLTSKKPMQLKIRSKADQAPSLYCPQLQKKNVIQIKDVLTFDVNASDDFGIQSIGMQWLGTVGKERNYEPASGSKIVSAGSPDSTEMTAVATFSPARLDIKPQVLQFRLYATDYLPNREPVYSAPYSIFVLSEADHAIWISRRIDQWYKQSLETYEQEVLNHDNNVLLRKLTPTELDRRENRNKLKAQVASEQANSRRLTALTELGTQLAKEASQNDQFDAQTVDALSKTVQKLDDIAKNRMPSVTDLLQKASDAPKGPGQPQSSEPNKPNPSSGPSAPSAPSVKDDQSAGSPPPKGAPPTSPDGDQPPPSPSISLQESSMDEPSTDQETETDEKTASPPPAPAPLTIPSVILRDNSPPAEQPPAPPAPPSAASDNLDQALAAQEDLLLEFQKVAEEMQKIVQNLEGSTFVKRLKAMSRRHLELAQDVNKMTLGEFGSLQSKVEANTQARAQLLAERELFHRQTTSNIQEDLGAFIDRVDSETFRTVFDEMKSGEVLQQLNHVSDKIVANESGGSIAHVELLADTFDRWAEQLVDAAESGEPSDAESEPTDGLPPKIILEFMKILAGEIDLRDETRSLQQAKAQLAADKFNQSAASLSNTQQDLLDRVGKVAKDISELDNAADFQGVTQILQGVKVAMVDTITELNKPHTGPETIAAETEVIELMLQAQRAAAASAGGSGSSPGESSQSVTGEGISALALLSNSTEESAKVEERAVEQTTGKAGYEASEEFRYGMDQYFEALEALESGQ